MPKATGRSKRGLSPSTFPKARSRTSWSTALPRCFGGCAGQPRSRPASCACRARSSKGSAALARRPSKRKRARGRVPKAWAHSAFPEGSPSTQPADPARDPHSVPPQQGAYFWRRTVTELEAPEARRHRQESLPIGEARRYRDMAHLRFVASQPCLIFWALAPLAFDAVLRSATLDRYEARALSRRRRAIRELWRG
jgi:hypothetical protein